MKNFLLIIFSILNLFGSCSLFSQWETNLFGNGYSRTLYSADEVIYNVTSEGVYYSTNSGNFWVNMYLPEFQANYVGTSIIKNEGRVFIGGEYFGIFSTSDFGLSWKTHNTGLTSTYITCLSISGTTLLAGTRDSGIYSSTNNGDSWIRTSSGLTNLYVRAITKATGNDIFIGTSEGISYSSNGGSQWISKLQGTTYQVTSIIFNNGNILAGTYSAGVFHSTDYGETWQQNSSIGVTTRIYCFAANGTNIFAGSIYQGLFHSSDNGILWSKSDSIFVANSFINSLLYFNDKFYAGAGNDFYFRGLIFTTNYGSNWSYLNSGLGTYEMSSLTSNGSVIYCGGGRTPYVYKSTNYGANWLQLGRVTNFDYINSLVFKDDFALAGLFYSGIFKSTNEGLNWFSTYSGNPGSILSLSFINSSNIFAGTQDSGLYKSNDVGSTWSRVKCEISEYFIYVIIQNGNNLFAGTSHGIYVSQNNGTNWTIVNSDSVNYINLNIISDNSNLYSCSNETGIFVSNNGGLNWTPRNSGLPSNNVMNIGKSGKYLLATVFGHGFYFSVDNGITWEQYNTGIFLNPFGYTYTFNNNFIFSTSYFGIYRLKLDELVSVIDNSESLVQNFQLFQNYPNPFNPITKISYTVPHKSFIQIKVFDILGKEVKMLVNEFKDQGKYVMDFNGSDIASGIYFYTLIGDVFKETKRMVLLK